MPRRGTTVASRSWVLPRSAAEGPQGRDRVRKKAKSDSGALLAAMSGPSVLEVSATLNNGSYELAGRLVVGIASSALSMWRVAGLRTGRSSLHRVLNPGA